MSCCGGGFFVFFGKIKNTYKWAGNDHMSNSSQFIQNGQENAEYTLKILTIGDSGVGKSCILVRYSDNTFTDTYVSTIGSDYKKVHLTVDGKIFQLQIWDTAGQERFRTITSSYYRKADGIVIVYDVTNMKSFENVSKWINEIETFAGGNEMVSKILIGNKCDLKESRVVSTEQGKTLADQKNIPFLETSAKTNENITQAFSILVGTIYERINSDV